MPKYPLTPEACSEAWIDYCRNEDHLLKKTIVGYQDRAKIVINTMLDHDREPLPYKWTKEDVEFFVDYQLKEKELRVKTVLGYHSVFTLLAEFYGNFEPSRTYIKWPEDLTSYRRWLELPDARKVSAWPKTPKQAIGIDLMLRMGRRRCECIRANIDDFIITERQQDMIVDGKGHKKFMMPFAPNFDKRLCDYLDNYRWPLVLESFNDHVRKAEAFKPLIIARHKNNTYGRYDEIKGTGYDKVITNAVSADCGIFFTNHDLRRTFGRELFYTSKVDIVTIMNYYNHANTEETLYYIGADKRRMSEEIQKIPF